MGARRTRPLHETEIGVLKAHVDFHDIEQTPAKYARKGCHSCLGLGAYYDDKGRGVNYWQIYYCGCIRRKFRRLLVH